MLNRCLFNPCLQCSDAFNWCQIFVFQRDTVYNDTQKSSSKSVSNNVSAICWCHIAIQSRAADKYGWIALRHWGRDIMATIFQTIFSHAFSWMKMYKFRLRFHWSLSLRDQLTIFQHCFGWWLGADQATSHYLNQWLLVYRRIYASPGLNGLKTVSHLIHSFPTVFIDIQ